MQITPPNTFISFEVVVTPQEAEELAMDAAKIREGHPCSPSMVKLLEVLQLLPQKL